MARRISQAELLHVRDAWLLVEEMRLALSREIRAGATIEPGGLFVDLDHPEFVTTQRRRRPSPQGLPSCREGRQPHARIFWMLLNRPRLGLRSHWRDVRFFWSVWAELKRDIENAALHRQVAAGNCREDADVAGQLADELRGKYYLTRLALSGALYGIGLTGVARSVAFASLRRVVKFNRTMIGYQC